MKKAIIFITLIAVFLFTLSSCVVISDTQDQDQGGGSAISNNSTNSTLGDYDVVIESARFATDYEGKPIIIVKYKFTNNGDDDACFSWSLDAAAYQDGVGLNECYFADDSANYSMDNQTKEIKKGATLSVEVAYKLNDTTTDVEVEVSELISWNDKKVTKTFSVEGVTQDKGQGQEQGSESATPDNSSESELGNYSVVIESARLAIDYTGKPIIIVKYQFTNNGDEPACFSWTLDDAAYQDGIGLNECYFADDSANYSMDNQTKEIKKGATLSVEVAYELNDTTTDVEVEVSELISWSDKKVTKTFSIQ